MPSPRTAAHRPLSRAQLAAVARLFRVLSEPTRLEILQLLRDGPRSVGELVELTAGKQANVSKQLGILHAAGLLSRTRDGSQVRYAVCEACVFELCGVVCAKLRRDAEAQVEAFA